MHTRRDFLKFAAMLSGATGIAGFVPDSIERAYAIAPTPGTSYLDAEHIVILMQENRSFDHALGTLRGVRGFNDPRALRQPNGNSVFVQTDASGNSYTPWRLDIKDTKITWMGSLPHSRESQVDAWNEGRHDRWLDAKRSDDREYSSLPITMGHYTREDLPFYYALADAFTVCDQNYCSVMTSTSPNRSYFWTGTIRDEQRADAKAHIRNEQIDYGGMGWKTFPERLQETGISWKHYQNELARSGLTGENDAWLSNFGDNVLECFNAYNVEAYPGYAQTCKNIIGELSDYAAKLETEIEANRDTAKVAKLHAQLEEVRNRIRGFKASLVNSGEARYQRLSEKEKALYDAAFVTNSGDPDYRTLYDLTFKDQGKLQTMQIPKGDILYQFRKDVNEGKLPMVSWITAPERFSDHPTAPWYGAWYVSEVMDILTKNPEVWKKTIFILTYDENDGYFDHAPSFVAADPKRPETGGASAGIDTGLEYLYMEDELRQGVVESNARTGPIGMGFRVPMIIASPWTRGGWVNSQLFDHTSTLMFLESFFKKKRGHKVKEENISNWRRVVAGNLTSAFQPYDMNEPKLDFLDRDKFVVSIQQARYKELPSNYRKLDEAQIEDVHRNLHGSLFTSHQELGIRPACALPYELYAEGGLSADRTIFELKLTAGNKVHGESSAGAPFNVYLRNLHAHADNGFRAATYAVKSGDTLSQLLPLSSFAKSKYHVEVHAPNGFYRSFRGGDDAGNVQVHTEYELKDSKLTGNIVVHMHNMYAEALTVTIVDNAYKTGPYTRIIDPGHKMSIVLHLGQSHNWYDFTVKVASSETEARFAGRVETGRSTFSDPLMGGIL